MFTLNKALNPAAQVIQQLRQQPQPAQPFNHPITPRKVTHLLSTLIALM